VISHRNQCVFGLGPDAAEVSRYESANFLTRPALVDANATWLGAPFSVEASTWRIGA